MDVLLTVLHRIRHEFKIREGNWRVLLADFSVSKSVVLGVKNGMFFSGIGLG